MRAQPSRRWSLTAFRAGLALATVLLLWRAAGAEVARLASPAESAEGRVGLAVLVLAAGATGVLTLHFPRRPNVSLVLLPAALAAWQFGPPAAALVVGFGMLLGNAWRRAFVLDSLFGAARVLLAVFAGAAAGDGVTRLLSGESATSFQVTPAWLLGALALALVSGLVDWLLDVADERLHAADQTVPLLEVPATFAGWTTDLERRATARLGRMDPLTNVLLVPLAVALQILDVKLGPDRMATVLGGMLALLFVVRALTNLRTANEALAEQRAKLATLFDHSGEGIYTVDGALRIDTTNRAMAELLGQPAEALAQRECAQVCHFEDLQGQRLCPERCPLVRAHTGRRPVTQEVLYQVPEQPPKHILLTYASVGEADEPLSLGIGIARDVTAEREAAKLRDEFVSLVTHELRSPLTVSIGYLDLLKRALAPTGGRPLDPERGAYYVGRIESAERHLLRLVNNLLELARVERPDLQLELGWVDLGRLVAETVDAMGTLANEKRQQVALELPDDVQPIWSSELYVKEILSNLVSNAVKYTPEEGQVTVTVAVRHAGDAPTGPPPGVEAEPVAAGGVGGVAAPNGHPGWIVISVRDTGYGMGPEDLARLFTKFFRSGRPEIRKERGTGLGLALAKEMTEKIGGTIGVQSELGKGSTFTVTLPLTTAPNGVPAPEPGESEPSPTAARTEEALRR